MALQTRTDTQSSQAGSPALLKLRGISKRYGDLAAVEPLDLDIFPRDFVAILGPSGCGKTTLLRIIGGFVSPTTGTVEIDGRDVTRIGPEQRPTNTVFQGYGLFPHMTVRQNVGYGLRLQKKPKAEIDDRVAAALRQSRLTDFADRSVTALSGGQQQRVALARALILRPKVSAARRAAGGARPQAPARHAGRIAAPAPGIRRHVSSSSPMTRVRPCRWQTASR